MNIRKGTKGEAIVVYEDETDEPAKYMTEESLLAVVLSNANEKQLADFAEEVLGQRVTTCGEYKGKTCYKVFVGE